MVSANDVMERAREDTKIPTYVLCQTGELCSFW